MCETHRFNGTFVWQTKEFQQRFDVGIHRVHGFTSIDLVSQHRQIVLPYLKLDLRCFEPGCLGASVGNNFTVISQCDGRVLLHGDDVALPAVLYVVNLQRVSLLCTKLKSKTHKIIIQNAQLVSRRLTQHSVV